MYSFFFLFFFAGSSSRKRIMAALQSIRTDVDEEREALLSEWLHTHYRDETNELASRAADEAKAAHLADIQQAGATQLLARFEKQSATPLSPEFRGMATDSDDVGRAVVGIVHAMAPSTASAAPEEARANLTLNAKRAAFGVRSLSFNTAAVLTQQFDQQSTLLTSEEASVGTVFLLSYVSRCR